MKDVLGVPESLFMLYNTVVALDHFAQVVKVITYIKVPENLDDLEAAYKEATATLQKYVSILKDKEVSVKYRTRRIRESRQGAQETH
jgi:anthranilate synthase component 1